MIIIPSGNSATFTLAANNQLTVTSRGGTTVTGPSGLLGTIDGTMTFGGYGGDTIITIAAVGNDCEYGVTEPDAAMVITDANNNTVLVGADNTIIAGPFGSFTWATKPAPADYIGGTIYISDIGIGGSDWRSDGAKWRPIGGRVVIKNLITPVSNNGAAKVVLDYSTIPAGLVTDGDLIEVKYIKERTGGTADTDATDVMVGANSGTPGTSLGVSTSGLATTSLQLSPAPLLFRRVSATSLLPVCVGGANATGTNTGPNTAVTTPNMDSLETYLQITSDLTLAGGEVSWLRGFIVTIIAGA